MYVLASKVFRTGKQTLYIFHRDYDGVPAEPWYFVRLENRTNDTVVRIPDHKVYDWWQRLL